MINNAMLDHKGHFWQSLTPRLSSRSKIVLNVIFVKIKMTKLSPQIALTNT